MTRRIYSIQQIVEKITGATFQRSVRPDWLLDSQSNNRLELDLYNEELRIGICHYGSHHYRYTHLFHRTIEDFHDLVRRDEERMERCQENGVLLIIVPYIVPIEDQEIYIQNAIKFVSLSTLCLRTARYNRVDLSKLPKALLV